MRISRMLFLAAFWYRASPPNVQPMGRKRKGRAAENGAAEQLVSGLCTVIASEAKQSIEQQERKPEESKQEWIASSLTLLAMTWIQFRDLAA
jgi:hypothetical protein